MGQISVIISRNPGSAFSANQQEKLGYTIGIIRNGMFITDNLANFGEPFKRFPLYREFALVIEPASAAEGEWFKRLENPSHNDLSAERITDPAMRQQGQKSFCLLYTSPSPRD